MDNMNKLELYMGRIAHSLSDIADELMVLRLEVKQAVDKLDNDDKESDVATKMSAFVKRGENNE